ncbi:hypothetical protein [Caulobacter sp. 17J65-9]|uniref:hypothetical protein n=1 Tax=Caulobacter sp. 17J65-9 TaxID=2709382 RepID=UPI0013CBADA6|nr:hypothetical protein [Caulobacter sp. 17J65-9]NEX95400.1 hypothetical protein [Caulobacter sp. 17J65-9]
MKLKWILPAVAVVCAAAAWAGMFVGLYLGVDLKTRTVLVTLAALSGEAVLWTFAAALGLTVFEARRRIWARLTGRAQ